jgi:hypothetical protein
MAMLQQLCSLAQLTTRHSQRAHAAESLVQRLIDEEEQKTDTESNNRPSARTECLRCAFFDVLLRPELSAPSPASP